MVFRISDTIIFLASELRTQSVLCMQHRMITAITRNPYVRVGLSNLFCLSIVQRLASMNYSVSSYCVIERL
jgi:hypothetical protein